MQRNLDSPSDSEGAIPLPTRRDALRRGLLLGFGVVAAAAVVGCAGGEGDEEEDEGD